MAPALIVFESVLGNTEQIARAVAEGLGRTHTVTLTEVGHAPDQIPRTPSSSSWEARPTPSGSAGRRAAAMQPPWRRAPCRRRARAARVARRPRGGNQRDPVRDLRHPGGDPRLPGSAAKKARKRLRAKGLASIVDPEASTSTARPDLADGEEERARAWGRPSASAQPHWQQRTTRRP